MGSVEIGEVLKILRSTGRLVRGRNDPELSRSVLWVALDRIHKLDPGTAAAVLMVVGFCLIQQLFLELPLLGYVFAPESTAGRVARARAWIGRRGRGAAVIGAAAIGGVLILRGLATLL